MNPIRTAVINSTMADKHFDDVRSQHSDILSGIKDHALRVQGYHIGNAEMNQQDNMLKSQERVEQLKMQHDQMKIQSDMQKHALEMDMKTKDMEMKRAALSSPQ